jgi:DNA-binding transcriptional regulator YhcF (GntR family)
MFQNIDPRSATPLYAQIASRVKLAIASGELASGTGLPSVRHLATELRVNPATVVQAYREFFEGRVEALERQQGLKIPHMGWNQLRGTRSEHPLLGPESLDDWFYFVHSFHAVPADSALVLATVDYGPNQITAAVGRDNVVATQFHPEKSQAAGLALLKRFLEA